jgi:hypothetical protein
MVPGIVGGPAPGWPFPPLSGAAANRFGDETLIVDGLRRLIASFTQG